MTSLTKESPLYGLVLVGGKSSRMKQNKAELSYLGKPHWEHCQNLLLRHCKKVFVSTSKNFDISAPGIPTIKDIFVESFGPLTGIISAMKSYNDAAFFVLACDMPFFDASAIATLANSRNARKNASAFVSPRDNKVEPTSTIYEPSSFLPLLNAWANGRTCPRSILQELDVERVVTNEPRWLDNANTPDERKEAETALNSRNEGPKYRNFQLSYFAAMREQRGCDRECVEMSARNVSELYAELKKRHRFTFEPSMLKVSVNDRFVDWDFGLAGGEHIVFLPPVAGG